MSRPKLKPKDRKTVHSICLDPGLFARLLRKVGNVSAWINARAREEVG